MPRTYEIEASHMLKNIRNFKYNTHVNFEPMNLLLKFYPNKEFAVKDIDTKSEYIYQNITRLVRQNYLKKIDNLHFAGRYKLTLHGKCRIMCCKFEINFLSLCILAEAHSIYKYQLANDSKQCYTLIDIIDTFTGIFTEKTIRNTGCMLCSQGFTSRITSNVIQIEKNTLKKLDKHDEILMELHKWIINVPNQINQLMNKDPDALNKIRH